ncbi:hypothetical protein U1Q18_034495 [Sarracenia purpurea var. burkii]
MVVVVLGQIIDAKALIAATASARAGCSCRLLNSSIALNDLSESSPTLKAECSGATAATWAQASRSLVMRPWWVALVEFVGAAIIVRSVSIPYQVPSRRPTMEVWCRHERKVQVVLVSGGAAPLSFVLFGFVALLSFVSYSFVVLLSVRSWTSGFLTENPSTENQAHDLALHQGSRQRHGKSSFASKRKLDLEKSAFVPI